jgi:phospholipase/lecithinase/hemolysin
MSSIQNYLNKAQEFSNQVSQEEQLEQSKTEIREKAESNIEDVRQRVEELKAGIAGDVGAFGFGTAGAVEKAFQYGKYVNEKAQKLKDGVNALRTGLDETEVGKSINAKISSLISPDSALGKHLQNVGDQVNKLKALTEKNPIAKTKEIMTDVDSRFKNLTQKGMAQFRQALTEKSLADPFGSGDPTSRLESAIQHNELLKQVEGVPDNVKKGLIGGAEPGAPLIDSLQPTEQEITEGRATTQDFTKSPLEELGTGGGRKVIIRPAGEGGR